MVAILILNLLNLLGEVYLTVDVIQYSPMTQMVSKM